MKAILLAAAAAVFFAGCQQPAEQAPSSESQRKAPVQEAKGTVQRQPNTATPAPEAKTAKASPTQAKKIGPKTTADSYEISDGCKIVSGTVVRMMRYSLIKGMLKAEKPPKAMKVVLEGQKLNNYYPQVRIGIYDAAARKWQDVDTITVKGKIERKYPLSNVPAGMLAFRVHYFSTDPAGGDVRPNVFVHSAELEF